MLLPWYQPIHVELWNENSALVWWTRVEAHQDPLETDLVWYNTPLFHPQHFPALMCMLFAHCSSKHCSSKQLQQLGVRGHVSLHVHMHIPALFVKGVLLGAFVGPFWPTTFFATVLQCTPKRSFPAHCRFCDPCAHGIYQHFFFKGIASWCFLGSLRVNNFFYHCTAMYPQEIIPCTLQILWSRHHLFFFLNWGTAKKSE